jgi:hypothetical protein
MRPRCVAFWTRLAGMAAKRRPHRLPSVQRISGPAELLQAVPYLLGFHPAASLVLVGLTAGRLVVTARLDLADAETASLPHTLRGISRGGATEVIAVVYGDAPAAAGGALPWRHLPPQLVAAAAQAGCELLETLLVADGRYWSYTCAEPACCPPEGRELPVAPSPFAAAATFDGMVALPDRAALEAQFRPLADAERERLDALIGATERAAVQNTLAGHAQTYEVSVKRALFSTARASAEPGWAGPADDETVARLGVALTSTSVRDAVWRAVDGGRLDGRPLWRELARRLPAPYDAPPLFLYGWAAWRAGDGTSAGIAAERAVQSDPQYTAADLLLAALSSAIDPRRVPKLRLPRSA